MANAAAEKLKAFGIRHGEKVAVGLTAAGFLALAFLGLTNPVMDVKPDELKTASSRASSNLNQKQPEADILAKLESEGIKEPNFQKQIESQIANALKPDAYRAKLEWVTAEPGAGLIRDQPELIAPTELAAFPGRGGILMYALDDKGERIPDTEPDAKNRVNRRGGGAIMGMGPMGGGAPGEPGGANSQRKEKPEEKAARELAERKKKGALAGEVQPKADPNADKNAPAQPEGPYKEEVKGKRWVVLTAVLDNAKLRKNYIQALKTEAAYPNFRRVDAERQELQSDGSWSEWAPVDQEKNWAVLDNLPETDSELVPDSRRPQDLVDALPFLKAGYWTGVHVAKLVPPEALQTSAAGPGGGGGVMGMGPMGGGDPESGGKGRPKGGASGFMGAPGGAGVMGGPMGRSGKGGPGVMGGPMGGGGGSAGPEEEAFTKYDEENLMIRSIDFTVEPDRVYRFRLRIVVANPNFEHTDVNPGVDTSSKSLKGPWSEASPPANVPADVVAYVQNSDATDRRMDQVNFQVFKWDPNKGHTVSQPDARTPGELIGMFSSVQYPSSDGKGVAPERIDFNSRSILLDAAGGRKRLPELGIPRNSYDVPALALILEPDGNVVLRNQAYDANDDVRRDMDLNYKQALTDSGKERGKGASNGMSLMGNQGNRKNGGNRGRGGAGSRMSN